MRFNYQFFDYKHNIPNFSSDMFSVPHIIFIILVIISAGVIFAFGHKLNNEKKIKLALKILAIFTIALEIAKISFETYWDVKTGRGFNKEGIIPVYTCSLFIYTLFLHAFTKGKASEYSLSFLTTVSLVSGLIGVIICNGLNWYPFWTFGAFYSMYFHASMFLVGVFLLASGYKKLEWKDINRCWIPMLLLSLIAIPYNIGYRADYMCIYSGDGVPLMDKLASYLASKNLRNVFTIIMLVTYLIIPTLLVSVSNLTYFIIDKIKKAKA